MEIRYSENLQDTTREIFQKIIIEQKYKFDIRENSDKRVKLFYEYDEELNCKNYIASAEETDNVFRIDEKLLNSYK